VSHLSGSYGRLSPVWFQRLKLWYDEASTLAFKTITLRRYSMGWTRNYHGYVFMDLRDGALFGPEGRGALDMEHHFKGTYWQGAHFSAQPKPCWSVRRIVSNL
jgi:hypothetical protein